jgi:HAD superfamily hydrolase (TIGR01509 family)
MLRAVVFDMDGLLIDTEWPDYQSWQEAFQECGSDLPLEDWVGHVGVWGMGKTVSERLADLRGAGLDLTALQARRRERYHCLVREAMHPLPGVRELIAELAAHGIRRAVASASDAEWVAFVLDGLELRPWLDVVVTGEEVGARKPAPDVYLRAAERLAVEPWECVALEDSCVGVQAARAAGMRCVAVPNRLTRHHDFTAADAQVPSLERVSVSWLAKLLE